MSDPPGLSRALVKTLLLTDLVGSIRLVEQLGDERAAELAARCDRIARDLLREFDGREIDKTDGFLLLFDRSINATHYALTFHDALDKLSAELGVELSARAGIHLGEVFLRENTAEDIARGAKPLEVEGVAKPTVARVASLAEGRQTLLTRGAFDLARRGAVGGRIFGRTVRWLAHGPYRFKGVTEASDVFEVGFVDSAPLSIPRDSEKAYRDIQGRTLRTMMEEMRAIPEALLRLLAAQVAREMESTSSGGEAPCYLQAGNVLITPDYEVKLALGSVPIMDGPADASAEFLSLGEVFYGAATYTFDDSGTERSRQSVDTWPRASAINPQITPFFEQVLESLLNKNTAFRFASLGELADVLEAGESSVWWHKREAALRAETPRMGLGGLQVSRDTSVAGRDEELGMLQSVYRDARAGYGRLVLVEGEAGIGKTRLITEFLERLRSDGQDFDVLYGSYPPGNVGGAHGALRQALVDRFGEASLESGLKPYLTVTPGLVPAFVAMLLGTRMPDGSELSVEGLHSVFCHLVRGLASARPLVWIV